MSAAVELPVVDAAIHKEGEHMKEDTEEKKN